jgi:hypothetical protein
MNRSAFLPQTLAFSEQTFFWHRDPPQERYNHSGSTEKRRFQMKSFFVAILCLLLSITAVVIPARAQCDGLPHPENGQPAPCGKPAQSSSTTDTRYRDGVAAAAQAQKDTEAAQAAAAAAKRERVRQCELQAQHDYEECTRLHPNSPCPLKPCANTL